LRQVLLHECISVQSGGHKNRLNAKRQSSHQYSSDFRDHKKD